MILLPYIFSIILLGIFGCKSEEKAPANNTPSTPKEIAALPPAIVVEETTPLIEITPAILEISPLPAIYTPILGGGGHHSGVREYVHFVPNIHEFWTNDANATTYLLENCTGSECECLPSEEGCQALPAFADILLKPENFVWCKGGPYALCYYSGPDGPSLDLGCTINEDGRFADCKCYEVAYGVYFVDIYSILNDFIHKKTVAVCGKDGSACSGPENINKAPVCHSINENKFIPGADLVSTFSLDCVPTDGLGQTNCDPGLYAGCMTAPCKRTSTKGIVECSCPVWEGPYQIGTTLPVDEECALGGDLVWSAAFSPSVPTLPPSEPCIPDAPGGNGCPLYNNSMQVPEGTNCNEICRAYECVNGEGIEPAYTCDATLCTGQCNEQDLLKEACEDLPSCPKSGIAAIIALESAAQCSCCASQLCGCTPNPTTNNAIFDLNARQRELTITPQCDVNGTLCGEATSK
jgi:hypothetical protein